MLGSVSLIDTNRLNPMEKVLRLFFLTVICAILPFALVPAQENADLSSRVRLRENHYRLRCSDESLSIEERLAAYDSLLCIRENLRDSQTCVLYREKGVLLDQIGRYSEAFFVEQELLRIMDSNSGYPDKVDQDRWIVVQDMARLSVNLGLYDQSTSYLYEILSEPSAGKDLHARACSLLSLVYLNMNRLSNAEEYIRRVENLMNSSSDWEPVTVFDCSSVVGAWYYNQGKYDSALFWMEKAGKCIPESGEKNRLVYTYNMSNIYLDMGEYGLAEENLLRILNDTGIYRHTSYIGALTAQNMAYIYFLEKKYKEALSWYERALAWAEEIDAKKIAGNCYIEMAELYGQTGDYANAWKCQQRGYVLRDSVFNQLVMEEILRKDNAFLQQKKELEEQIVAQKLIVAQLRDKNKTIVLSVLFVILAVLIVLLLFSLHKLRSQEKDNSRLSRRLEDSEMSHSADMELQNRKLTQNHLMLVQSDELLEFLRNSVKKLRTLNVSPVGKETVEEMYAALSAWKPGRNWDEFSLYFEKVNPGFFDILNRVYPQLTRNEQRVCALIYLNLSAKEIASITFRSVRTVETVIYSIRKKLDIPAEEKTRPFLAKKFGELF